MKIHPSYWVTWGIIGSIALALSANGCSQVLGLEDWEDPLSSSSSSVSGAVGAGGAGNPTGAGGAGGAGGASSAAAACDDGVKNGSGETDVDCGGADCPKCAAGQKCAGNNDCQTNNCMNGVCDPPPNPPCVPEQGGGGAGGDSYSPRCNDCVKNGAESDVDCGGDACLPCGAKKACIGGQDCLSNICSSGHCAVGLKGSPCKSSLDCESTQCAVGGCPTAFCCQ